MRLGDLFRAPIGCPTASPEQKIVARHGRLSDYPTTGRSVAEIEGIWQTDSGAGQKRMAPAGFEPKATESEVGEMIVVLGRNHCVTNVKI